MLHTWKATQNVHYLHEKFYNLRLQDSDDLATSMGEIKTVINQLKNLGEDCFSDKVVITKLTCNLPLEYDSMLKAWESVIEFEKTLENLRLRLLTEEHLIKKHLMEVGGELTTFFVGSGGFQYSRGFGFIGSGLQSNNLSRFGGAIIHQMQMGRKINHDHF